MTTDKKILLLISFLLVSSCSTTNTSDVDKNYSYSIERAKDYIDYYSDNTISNEAESHYINGLTQQQVGNYAESLIDFNQALSVDSSAAILYSMAKSYYQLNRLELTLETLVKSIEIQEDFVPSMELLSSIYFRLNDISNAIAVNEKIVAIDPTYSRKLELAELYESHDQDKAKAIYEELYKQSKDSYILRKLTELYSNERDSDKYTFLIKELYFNNLSNANAGLELLDHFLEKKLYQESFNVLDKADSNIATEKLSAFYGTTGFTLLNDRTVDNDLIDIFLQKIDNRFYFDWRIQMVAGYLNGKIKQPEKALNRFNNAFKLTDTIPDIYFDAGTYFMQLTEIDFAKKVFELGVDKFPDSPDLNYLLGLSLQDDFVTAIPLFKKAIDLSSEFIEPHLQLGLIYDNQKNLDSTIFYYNKALEIDPDNALVNNNYAYTLSQNNQRLEDALKMSKISLKKEPNSAIYLDTYGWILFKMGKNEEALDYVREAVEKGGVSAEVYEHLGEILKSLNRNNEALEAYRNALKLDPNSQSARNNINNLE